MTPRSTSPTPFLWWRETLGFSLCWRWSRQLYFNLCVGTCVRCLRLSDKIVGDGDIRHDDVGKLGFLVRAWRQANKPGAFASMRRVMRVRIRVAVIRVRIRAAFGVLV